MPVAIVTGASRGLGLALARSLADDGWSLVVDARGAEALEEARTGLAGRAAARETGAAVVAVQGDVADAGHRLALIDAARSLGGLDLLVNNASELGPSPLPSLADYPLDELERVLRVNVLAPLALAQLALPLLRARRGRIVNLSSDAAVEAYEGWGGYGSSKAALEQLTLVMAAEEDAVKVYVVDPGDMRTAMHQAAFPGEDISDRPPPEASVPGLRRLVDGDEPSGRYRAHELVPAEAAP
ncbi:MAG TPA: SDR family oxidoreductase [Actinomycetes bacterium]|nr:SDR family oxidoreductase [Actinomycetes bacterium]